MTLVIIQTNYDGIKIKMGRRGREREKKTVRFPSPVFEEDQQKKGFPVSFCAPPKTHMAIPKPDRCRKRKRTLSRGGGVRGEAIGTVSLFDEVLGIQRQDSRHEGVSQFRPMSDTNKLFIHDYQEYPHCWRGRRRNRNKLTHSPHPLPSPADLAPLGNANRRLIKKSQFYKRVQFYESSFG